jgi:hypothetical protein
MVTNDLTYNCNKRLRVIDYCISDLWFPGKISLLGVLSVLYHKSLVLSSAVSVSLLFSSSVFVSLSLAKNTAGSHNCVHKLVVGA